MPRYLSLVYKVNIRCKECGGELRAVIVQDNNEIDITVHPCPVCKQEDYNEGYDARRDHDQNQ
jgi:Zn finger protein HypA/HybF involved in hydrogenase expression